MGNSVAQPLRGVAERPAGECARIVSAYVARSKCADFEFGAGLDDVQSLTASSKAEAADICELLTRNKDSNQVNVLVLLAAACLVCEADTLAVPGRASLVYDVFNFDADSDLSRDELTILLMCVFRAMNCVSDHAANDPNYALMDKLASTAFGNEQRETMRKDDFVLFVKGFCSGADDFPALLVKAGLLVAPFIPDPPAEPPAVDAVVADAASADAASVASVETATVGLRDSFDMPPPALTGVNNTPLERSVPAVIYDATAGTAGKRTPIKIDEAVPPMLFTDFLDDETTAPAPAAEAPSPAPIC